MWGRDKYKDDQKQSWSSEQREAYEERKKQTFFDYPEEGYGLADDPVLDELIWLDIMEGR